MLGTIPYMAPEQLKGERADARADVYSLECVLFEALTGRVPYDRDRLEAVIYAHLESPAPKASELVPYARPWFDEVIARALAKDPDERYPSAGDLGLAALAASEGRPVPRAERSVATGEAAPSQNTSTTKRPAQRLEHTAGIDPPTTIVSPARHAADPGSSPSSPPVADPSTAGAAPRPPERAPEPTARASKAAIDALET
ncbi:MAG: hypothetical protein WCD11_04170, partial [Solirubrobacteraceae bacterium]